MSKVKTIIVVSLILLISAVAMSGVKQDAWVIDDFESYAADPNTIHASSLEGPGWWTIQELEASLLGIIPPEGFVCQFCLASGDPNGFMASAEVDTDGPKSMQIHYELPSGYSCDAFIFAHNLGLPFEFVQVGYPFAEYLAAVDLTQYQKICLKIKKFTGNKSSAACDFSVGFMGLDLQPIGLLSAVTSSSVPAFMEYPEDVWEVLEFDLTGELIPGTSQSGLDSVGAVTFGVYDEPGTAGSNVTYMIDEITFYKDSSACPLHKSGDMNLDCTVNIMDFVILSEDWLSL